MARFTTVRVTAAEEKKISPCGQLIDQSLTWISARQLLETIRCSPDTVGSESEYDGSCGSYGSTRLEDNNFVYIGHGHGGTESVLCGDRCGDHHAGDDAGEKGGAQGGRRRRHE